jgi:hypothetical protein
VRQINIEKVALYRHRIPKSKEDQVCHPHNLRLMILDHQPISL